MPFYIYVKEGDETGETAREEFFPVSDFRNPRMMDGEKWVISTALQQRSMACGVGSNSAGEKCYPKFSDAMRVDPSQVKECQEVYRKAGLGVQEFDRWGSVKINGMEHQRKLEKARGFVNRASYSG